MAHEAFERWTTMNLKYIDVNVFKRYGHEKLDSASLYLTKVIIGFKKAFGAVHWLVYPLRTELIQILSAQDKIDEAIQEATDLGNDMQEGLTASHPLHYDTKIALAVLYMEQYRWEPAVAILGETKRTVIEELGSDHFLILKASGLLAKALMEQGEYKEAGAEYDFISKLTESNHTFRDYYKRNTALNHCTLLEKQGKFHEAEELRHRVVDVQAWPSKSPKLMIEHNQAWYTFRRGEFSLAESCLTES
ncbi:hypothetical protein IL306_003051 [Fusarium sp. DS 682]|nr:hypothetical protein IL306_003051 [Fusarium sp. DS 682]